MSKALAAAIVVLGVTVTAAQADEIRTGVLCTQAMLLGTKASVQLCKWERTAADDAIDIVLPKVDAFIIKNASRPVTQEQLDAYEVREIQQSKDDFMQEPGYCSFVPGDKTAPAALPWFIHTMGAAKLSAWIDNELSVPREPDMNPCL